MVTNAQLDNTKTSNVFQLELLKEQLEEQEEGMIEVQREYKDKCRVSYILILANIQIYLWLTHRKI